MILKVTDSESDVLDAIIQILQDESSSAYLVGYIDAEKDAILHGTGEIDELLSLFASFLVGIFEEAPQLIPMGLADIASRVKNILEKNCPDAS